MQRVITSQFPQVGEGLKYCSPSGRSTLEDSSVQMIQRLYSMFPKHLICGKVCFRITRITWIVTVYAQEREVNPTLKTSNRAAVVSQRRWTVNAVWVVISRWGTRWFPSESYSAQRTTRKYNNTEGSSQSIGPTVWPRRSPLSPPCSQPRERPLLLCLFIHAGQRRSYRALRCVKLTSAGKRSFRLYSKSKGLIEKNGL